LVFFKQNIDCKTMNHKQKEPQNYLTLVPIRKITECNEVDEKITLLVPKFKNAIFRNWFIPKSKSIHYKIHLDDLGSHVWLLINDTRTVQEICDLLQEYLVSKNKPSTQVEERVTKFLSDLNKNGFIGFNEAQPQSGG
jgi:hypothetical protein